MLMPTPHRLFRRLDAQLITGFVLVALIPVAVTSAYWTWRSDGLAQSFVTEHVDKTAQSYAAGLDLFLEKHRGRLGALDMRQADPGSLSATVAADPSLEALWVADAGVSSEQQPAEWARQACDALSVDRRTLMTHAGEGQAHEVVLAVPHDSQLLCAQITFTLHQDMLTEQASSAWGAVAYIVDTSGVVVCHSFEESEPHVPRGVVLSPAVAEVAALGEPWAGAVEGEERLIAAFATSRELPWGVWVEVPSDVAVAPFRSGLLRSGVIAGLIGLLAAGVAFLLARRLGAPVRALSDVVRRVGQGDLGARVPVSGPAEIAELAHAFNGMSNALAQSQSRLEERVEERTHELANARAFSDRLLDTMRQRILVIDPDLNVVRVNKAARDAYGEGIVGRECRTIHGSKDAVECPAQQAMHQGAPRIYERNVERNGRSEVLSIETVPLTNERGEIVGALEIEQDITEIKRIRAHLAQQQKMAAVGTLAAGLAHEIGNPLASMSSELEMLERMWDADDAKAALPVLRDQVRRMSMLLRELMSFGHPTNAEPTTFAPKDLLEEVARLLRHDPRCRAVSVCVVTDDALPLLTSRDQVLQVLVNLGLNALDALDGSGQLTLHASQSVVGEANLSVQDTGPGVPDDLASQLFDPFFTTKPPGRGTGLGLFVSERLVQGLGGRIELDNTNAGARFTVVLPRSGSRLEPAQ